MPTMTTEEIAPAIESKRTRASQLAAQKAALQKSHAAAIDTVARAIAAGRNGEGVAAARKVARSAGDEIAEIDGAIEVLLKETAMLERQRKEAEKHEAVELANQLVGEAWAAISAVSAAVNEAAATIKSLLDEADSKVYSANVADNNAKTLSGQPINPVPRVVWSNKPGLETIAREIAKRA